MPNKLRPKLILIDVSFVFFLITGMKRLYLASQSEIYDAMIQEDSEKFKSLTDSTAGEVIFDVYYWTLAFLAIAVLIVGLINWRYKTAIVNSILTLIIAFLFFPLGLINGAFIPDLFNSFCYFFSDEMGMAFMIGGLILCGIALMLLSFSLDINRQTIHSKP